MGIKRLVFKVEAIVIIIALIALIVLVAINHNSLKKKGYPPPDQRPSIEYK